MIAQARNGEPPVISETQVLLASSVAPVTYNDAMSGPDAATWVPSMQTELTALVRLKVWNVTERTDDIRSVGSRWFYTVKPAVGSSPLRPKSRLVAQGYSQIEGIDFFDTSAPVVSKDTVRVAFAIAAALNWNMGNSYKYGPI